MTPKTINRKIKKLPDNLKGKISDGYHTFAELYDHRCILFINLLNIMNKTITGANTWKSKKNSDGTEWEGWFVAGIEDKITYHLPIKLWPLLEVEELPLGKWDGHTSSDVLLRLAMLAKSFTLKDEEE